jgi:hypothetical protein
MRRDDIIRDDQAMENDDEALDYEGNGEEKSSSDEDGEDIMENMEE